MIFVTVGTHEQSFDRLIIYIDDLKRKQIITEDVIMQIGVSSYRPKFCEWDLILPYKKMMEYTNNARLIITHGGPSSFLPAIQMGKIPVVVPRQKRFNEHVNDHQLEFSRKVSQRFGNILLVENIDDLEYVIKHYDTLADGKICMEINNNEDFCNKLERIVEDLMV